MNIKFLLVCVIFSVKLSAMQLEFDGSILYNTRENSLTATANNGKEVYFSQWKNNRYQGTKDVTTRVGTMRYLLNQEQALNLYIQMSRFYNKTKNEEESKKD